MGKVLCATLALLFCGDVLVRQKMCIPFLFGRTMEGLTLFKDVLDSCLWGSTPIHSSSAYSCSRLLVVTWESKLSCPFFPARCRPDTDRQTSFGPSQLFSPCGKSCMHQTRSYILIQDMKSVSADETLKYQFVFAFHIPAH